VLTASALLAPAPAASDETRRLAREQLTFLLQLAYSGELAATRAYLGHQRSLRARTERAELETIIRDEIRHRHCLLAQLAELGAAPVPARERKMELVGRSIAAFCAVGGWFFPMYGAGRLEAQNIREYEAAARLALVAELPDFVESMLEMAETEWDHERYFRTKASRHPFWHVMPRWPLPPPREDIRSSYAEFAAAAERPVEIVRAPWLIR
jgi:rubrerythrin